MKRLLYVVLAAILVYSCSTYDDTWIHETLQKHKDAVSRLESDCQLINENISSMEAILTSIQNKDIIKSVSAIEENGNIIGYELNFQKRGILNIYHGEKGKDGLDGEKGKDGASGKDGIAPALSVRQDTDGIWYWTINGEWCYDSEGNKVPALNNDDVTPKMKIEEDCWYLSLDNGQTWEMLCYATGAHGDLIFSEVKVDESLLILTLSDGTELQIPRVSDLRFELDEIKTNIQAASSFQVGYQITGGTGNTEIHCIGEHGWMGEAVPASNLSGVIKITAPDVLYEGKIVIFVTDEETTLMKAIMFDGERGEKTFISTKYDYYEVDGTGGFVDVIISTNQEYQVRIPEDAQSWISHVETRALREDRVRFGISDNRPGNPSREAEIEFICNQESVKVLIHQKASPFIESEVDLGPIDGFENTESGIIILNQATKGNGTDIVIMGDGFTKKHFVPEGRYETVMKQAYEDFFSVEPYASLKEYFNVYYINVLSAEEHDAKPYYDSYGNQNGAVQGTAETRLGTTFTAGSTSLSGNDDAVLEYATQAIEMKGGTDGGTCSYSEAYDRAHKALIIVMANVECYAGTCVITWSSYGGSDYAPHYSIAYCALGNDGTGRQCKYTLIHEAGGHGFGKLSDEYSNGAIYSFSTYEWTKLQNYHGYGIYRNVNEYWTYEESLNWSSLDWEYTTESNVYWTDLLSDSYGYTESEGLGIYEGGYTYSNLFCRSTDNSLMNNQLSTNGQFFNAISRWAIWYRTMKLADCTNASDFKSSLSEFIEFDSTLSIVQNKAYANAYSGADSAKDFHPLGSPVLVELK